MSPTDFGLWAVGILSVILLASAVVKMLYVPLAVGFEVRLRLSEARRRRRRRAVHTGFRDVHRSHRPLRARQTFAHRDAVQVSVIVPAYNEAVVIEACVDSIVRSRYPHLEVILVDDGSTDATGAVMAELAARYPGVRAVTQPNAGKGAALNRGIAMATGEYLLFVDADGLFTPNTIEWLMTGFTDKNVGAVCGDDRPANADRVLTRLLSVLSHVGTGLVRRALSVLRCLPIVSGNIGAFRADVVRQIGGFREDTLGEDLELTWRIYAAGYRVTFQPRALVYAESPSTLHGLWRQRVRWARGLLQSIRIHRTMMGNPAYGVFGVFLAFNAFAMVIAPVLQLAVLVGVIAVVIGGASVVSGGALALLGWLGLLVSIALVVLSICLDSAWHDLRYLWTAPLWPFYSVLMGLTMVSAVVREVRGDPSAWNKLQRTGVVTHAVTAGMMRQDPTWAE